MILSKEQIKELEYKGVYDIETGLNDIVVSRYNDEGEEIDSTHHSVLPCEYVMRIDNATVILDPTYDNILDSIVICEAPLFWYGMSTLLKVIEMINLNKYQKKN